MGQYFQPQDLGVIGPELELALFGMIVLVFDLLVENKRVLGYISLAGIAWSGYFLFRLRDVLDAPAYGGVLTLDPFAWFFKAIFLVAAALAIAISLKYLDIERENHGEYYALILFATMGMMFMAGAMDLVTLYIGLETMAIATYVLVGFLRGSTRSNEASLKYFLLGAFSSAILLYGFSLLYGIAGSTKFTAIGAALQQRPPTDALSLMALGAVAAGLFFKIAAVPFHQWTPDAYEGAPTSITAFMSVAVKAASFAMMVRLFLNLSPTGQHWLVVLSVVSALTMTVGNIAAITQSNVKRLLAYSSISHAGYILLGLIAGTRLGITAILIYLLTYTFTNLGAWAIVVALRRKDVIGEHIDEMSGLFFRHPYSAVLMLIFLLSLAGLPPTAGFIGKYFLFAAVIETQHNTLAVIAVLNAAISMYFYLRIVVAMFMREPTEKTGLELSPGVIAVMAVSLIFTLWIGLYPDPFIAMARHALSSL